MMLTISTQNYFVAKSFMRYLLVYICILYSIPLQDIYLKPFKSDGCSLFPDGTFQQQTLWLDCCVDHDYSYWKGGTYKQRLLADIQLQQCVEGKGMPNIANLVYLGVRIGGAPYIATPFRWGFGWSYLRSYKVLGVVEKRELQRQP